MLESKRNEQIVNNLFKAGLSPTDTSNSVPFMYAYYNFL